MEFKMENKSHETRLQMLPVCEECGYVFRDGVVVEEIICKTIDSDLKYSKYAINPPMCPNCQRIIECVEVNNNIIKEGF